MPKRILIDAVYPEETRVVIVDNSRLQEFDYETPVKKQLKGNLYLAKVTRVEPSLQAAFVDYGGGKHGFLPFAEIHPDYYQIPASDRDRQSEEATPKREEEAEDGIANVFIRLEESGLAENAVEETSPVASAESIPAERSDDDESGEMDEAVETGNLENGDVEELDNDIDALGDEEEDRREELSRRYHIQEVIKRGQVLLVQVIKEERGNKGASLTTYLSLAGRYCVLMPNTARAGGVSRKISSVDDRRRLKAILGELDVPKGTSVIIRTAGGGKSKPEIWRDFDYLVRLWNHIREVTLSAKAPAFIHAEDDLIKRTIRDMYNSSMDEVLVDGEDAYESAKKFIKMLMPSHAANVKQYKGDVPIFLRFQVEEQLAGLYRPEAYLDSGGYIVINPTEAMIAIDVNSGKATSERNIEETALKTNLEAAREVARQLRLRDLSGLIVVDFIDMMDSRNRRSVERVLKESLQSDRARIQIGRISPFGLLEMSRQRLRPSFVEANTTACPHCDGRGVIRAKESTAVTILRAIANEAYRGGGDLLEIYAAAEVFNYMLNQKRADIVELEKRFNITIVFFLDNDVGADGFAIEKKKLRTGKVNEAATSQSEELVYAPEEDFYEMESSEEPIPAKDDRKRSWKDKKPSGRQSKPRSRERSEDSGNVESISAPRGGRSRNRPSGGRGGNNRGGSGNRNNNRKGRDGRQTREDRGSQSSERPQNVQQEGSLLKGLWKRITQ